jgi:hypothetical protein
VNNVNGVLPPDTDGAVGINHYIQWVNLSYRIWQIDRNTNTATPVYGPATGNTLWAGFGGPCESQNDGDIIVLFDHLANRWFMSQPAWLAADGNHQCIAVSQSDDPLGAWYRYDFLLLPTALDKFNDYPKFGIWPDGYYMTANLFNNAGTAWRGAGVWAFERDKMLVGQPARVVFFDLYGVNSNFGGMLPADLDGPPPPAGTPNFFAEVDDSTWIPPNDAMRIWEFRADWTNPADSSFGVGGQPNYTLNTAAFNLLPCVSSSSRSCIPQPGTGVKLDSLGDRLVFRLAYRNLGSHQALVVNHTVWADGSDRAGVRWYEVRNAGAGWAIHQQGTFAPADGLYRWMGSAAMDAVGDIAVGYSVANGSSVYPSIRYAGRLAADPAGTLPQGEGTLITGSGAQTHSAARWGDYAALAVDPTDDCSFWFTTEYIQTTGSAPWQTRVGSFRFPSCTPLPKGTLQGTVTDASDGSPIVDAQVTVGGIYTTLTDADGFYRFQNSIPVGAHDVTVVAYGYSTGTAAGVVVTEGGTTTQDFALTPLPTATVNGTVSDGSGGDWPLYARIDITAPGYHHTAFTDPVTGHYSVNLVQATAHTFAVSAISNGYNTVNRGVTPPAGGAIENFALTVTSACAAPGYLLNAWLYETFDSVTPPTLPTGWAKVDVSGTSGDWLTNSGTRYPSGGGAHSAPNLAYFNSYTATSGHSTRLYRTTGMNLTGAGSVPLTLWMYHDTGYTSRNDRLQVQVSTNGGSSWTNVGSAISRYDGSTGWKQHTVSLNAFAGQADVRLGLLRISAYGNDVHIDDLVVGSAACTVQRPGGLVVSNVYDANTAAALNDATVTQTATAATATTFTTPDDPAVDDGLYLIFSPAGAQPFSATKGGGYGVATASVAVPDGGAIRQDFHLPAGRPAAAPAGLEVTLVHGQTARNVTLNNSGGLAALVSLHEVNTPPAMLTPGPFAPQVRHLGPKKFNVFTLQDVAYYIEPPQVPELPAGAVLGNFPAGLPGAWGIGFNLAADDMWIGNIAAGGGDDLDYRFLTDGTNTGDTIDTGPWAASWAADMTYHSATGKLWQVNVGGDNCIYELDPVARAATGNKICPAFGTSERGLAYDPLGDSFFAGSWNDSIIKRFDPDGTIVQSVNVGLAISGLAYNPATDHLFVAANDDAGYDVYVLDVNANYAVLGGFNIAGMGNFQQAGLEIDCDGHLWAVNQSTDEVYEVDSGEAGVCDWADIPWLTLDPTGGTVPAAGSLSVTFALDATGVATGTHRAYVRADNDTPYGVLIIPVTLNINPLAAPAVSAAMVGNGIELRWVQTQAGVERYEVYRSTSPYFTAGGPGSEKLTPDVPAPGVGNEATRVDAFEEPPTNCYYIVLAVGAGEAKSPASNRVAAFHFALTPGAE